MKRKCFIYFPILLSILTCIIFYLIYNERIPFPFTKITRNLFASSSNTIKNKTITAYFNGASTNGVQIIILLQSFNIKTFPTFIASQLHNYKVHKDENKMDYGKLYTGNGKLIEKYDDFNNGDSLYYVPSNLLFIWPFVKQGHKVILKKSDRNSLNDKPFVIESFNEHPRIFHLHNFFNENEADLLIKRILEIDDETNKLQQSQVGHSSKAKLYSKQRTSENAFDSISETSIKIKKRSFHILNIGPYNEDMCDGLQLLRYQLKQAYIPHTDYFNLDTSKEWNWNPLENGSNRFATIFLYLSNVTKGGQTVFPKVNMPKDIPDEYKHPNDLNNNNNIETNDIKEHELLFNNTDWEYDLVEKCQTKLAVYPRKAHAILFYSQKPNGELDPSSLHGGCPVLNGTKWGANLWIWNKKRFGIDPISENKKSISVTFFNKRTLPIDLYWDQVKMSTLLSGEKILYDTYDKHKWVFYDNNDKKNIIFQHTMNAKDGEIQEIIIPSNDQNNGKQTISSKTVDLNDKVEL